MKTILHNTPRFFFLAALIIGLTAVAFSQKPPKPPEKTPKPSAETAPVTAPPALPPPVYKLPVVMPGGGEDYEKSIAVDPKVNINMCIVTGEVKINGWDRNEVRVFIQDGSNLNFNAREKDRKSGQPVWIDVLGHDPDAVKHKKTSMPSSDCIWGSEIEIDVPVNAILTIKGAETTINIDSVRKATVNNAGGSISVRNVGEGVSARTYEGNITISDSEGAVNLETASGNILAFNLSPEEIGDTFRAKTTSGRIFLQQIEQRQIEVNSVSGSILFSGKLLGGGLYSFSTSNGTISLTLPADSSSKISASYGFGQFNCEHQLKDLVPNNTPRFKSLTAVMGSGDAMLKLSTNDGSIKIRKMETVKTP
jgi:hypothetical protein